MRLKLGLFLRPTSLWLLLTFLGSGTLLGGAGLNWGLGSDGVRPKLGPAPKMAEALPPLHDGSGRLGKIRKIRKRNKQVHITSLLESDWP